MAFSRVCLVVVVLLNLMLIGCSNGSILSAYAKSELGSKKLLFVRNNGGQTLSVPRLSIVNCDGHSLPPGASISNDTLTIDYWPQSYDAQRDADPNSLVISRERVDVAPDAAMTLVTTSDCEFSFYKIVYPTLSEFGFSYTSWVVEVDGDEVGVDGIQITHLFIGALKR